MFILLLLCIDASNNPHHLCLVTYRTNADFTPVLSAHGNAKQYKPFHPTWPSTLDSIKEQSLNNGPKATVEQVSIEVGGMMGASGSGQLPRNEMQVQNQRRKAKIRQASKETDSAIADV